MIDFLTEEEKHQLLVEFNDTAVAYPQDKTIIDLFEAQVLRTPDHVAIVFEETELTYQELNAKANQLARYLRDSYAIQPDDLVGIKLDRSERMIISILGILKSGAAYVPIDTNYPEERIAYIEKDSNSKVVLDEESLKRFGEVQEEYSGANIEKINAVHDLAYVIYTSGTTGNPKGVMVEHTSLINRLEWMQKAYPLSDRDVILQKTSYSFDVSVWELFWWLYQGSKLCILKPEGQKDPAEIIRHIERYQISVLHFVPSMLSVFLDYLNSHQLEHDRLKSLKQVFVSGEALTVDQNTNFFAQFTGVSLMNLYGPTEATIDVSYFDCSKGDQLIPIGKPIDNIQLFILNDRLGLVPIGVTGKLYISGAGLARGYLNKAELTAEKFVAHPFLAGCLMYDTGDLGRWLADGNIEYMGRKDQQVKIRGFRIELGEIENAVSQYSDDLKQVVVESKAVKGEKALVAYFTSGVKIDKSALRSFLAGKLPDYMVPNFYMELEELPLTPNGKIDRKGLPGIDVDDLIREEYSAPRSKEEKLLVSVWEDVLKRDSISIKDSFYNLGGDSIKSIQIVSRLKQHGYTLKIQKILQVPVLADLAKYMEVSTRVFDQSVVTGEVNFTPIQRYFLEDPIFKVHHHFNQSVLLKSREDLNGDFLARSISILLEHHDALRMVYRKQGTNWLQFNQGLSPDAPLIPFYDLREEENELEAMAVLGEKLQSGFDLETGPLFQACHFRLKDGDRLALLIHHLVVDGVSWRILLEDLSTVYRQLERGESVKLPLKTDSFQRWACLQQEYAQGDKLKLERSYWEAICSEPIAVFPKGIAGEQTSIKMDSRLSFSLDESITELLQTQVHEAYNTEINDILLTGLGLALRDTFGLSRSVVKMEGHGREDLSGDIDISRTVGWFTSAYPFVLNIRDSKGASANLIEIKEDLRRIPGKGIGFGIQQYLSAGFEDKPDYAIEFNYLGDFGDNVSNEPDSLFGYSSEAIGSGIASENENDTLLSISGILVSGQLSMSINYSKELYALETIEDFSVSYQANLIALIKELSLLKEQQLTPSDLTFKGLSIADLSELNADNMVEDVYKLSPLQQGIYYHWLSEESTSMYFEQMSYRIKAASLDAQSIRESYDKLLSRHGVLRTSFTYDLGEEPLQIVRKRVDSNFSYQRIAEGIDPDDYVEEIKLKDREVGFDLKTPCQMRLQVLDLGGEEYEFIWSHHHILADGWCISILIKDFYEILNAANQNLPLNLPEPVLYSNYIQWLDIVNTNDSVAYWKEYLAGYNHVAEIPFKTARAEAYTYKRSNESLIINGDLYAGINKLCSQIGVTQNTFMQAVWGYLLSRYNNTQDVVFGSVVSGRPGDLEGVEDMIGLFINTIPVRVRYDEDDTPLDLLRQVQDEAISGNAHHYLNLSEVQSQSELGMNLIDHIMVFDNYPVQDVIKEDIQNSRSRQDQKLTIESIAVFEQTNYDFSIKIFPSSSSLIIEFKYNSNQYDTQLIKNMINHVSNLVKQFVFNATNPLNTLPYLSEQEQHQLLVEFNSTKVDYPGDKTIVDLFEEQVLRTPDHVAIVFEETQLTYKELDEKSNQLSCYLQGQGVGVDSKVILCFDGFIDLQIVGLLGIIKSGAIYIPIEPDSPQERIEHILEDTKAEFIITSTNYSDIFNNLNNNVLLLDKFSFNGKSIYNRNKFSQNNICNIIHTSGSTGRPKGVLVSHGNIMDYLFGLSAKIKIEENDSFAMMSTISTDLGSTVLFSALIFGKTIHMFSKDSLRDIYYIRQYFADHKIDCIKIVPTYWAALNENDKMPIPGKMVIFGGEKLTNGLAESIIKRKPGVILINHYGPTETTIGKFLYVLDGVQKGRDIPIGKAFSNTKSYVLDKQMELCPIGVKGELYIGGDGVTKGYLNNLTLTEEKFIENCIVGESGKLYKTGDLVVMLPDGNIEFKGRIDSQVKILGHRIELNEIERVINEFPMIKTSVVIVKSNNEYRKELIAYIVTEKTIDKQLLRSYLQSKLPVYMIPGFYLELESLPLTLTGKIDRKSLPAVTEDYLISNEHVEPRNETEEKLVAIWKDVLGVGKIGITDNFFELGGHSLSVAQVINRINKQFGKTITFKTFFANPTIEGSSGWLQEKIYIAIPEAPETESYPLTASQSRLWILSQLEGGSLAYNIQATVKLKGEIDSNKFEDAFRLVIHRHEILRTSIKTNEEGDTRQYIIPAEQLNFKISREDYTFVENQKKAIISYVEEKNREPFDLEQAPLLRASLIKLKEEEYVFFSSLHHIIGDGWSMELLISEVVKAYNALVQGKEINLPELSIQYKDYAVWLNSESQQAKQQASEQYWMQQFEGEMPVLDLPSFKTRPLVQTYNGSSIVRHFPKTFLEKLRVFSKEQDVTLFMTLMAGVNTLLYKYTGQDDIIIGTPIAGREHPDLEKQIGLHLNTLAIRTRIKAGSSFLDMVSTQKETLLGAYEHQSYPFDALVGKLNLKWDTSRSALFDVLVVLQSQGQLNGFKGEELVNLEVSNYDVPMNTSRFDISFNFIESDGLYMRASYNTDIYDAYLIERMFTHFENLLTESLQRPEQLIQEVDYLTEEEKRQLLISFNDTAVAYPQDKTIIDLFEAQVLRSPDHVAIVFEDLVLTYQELNVKANQLAGYLRENYSVQADDLIGIKLDRSEQMIISILGILKSGAAYVPIDMNYPEERIAYIETDSKSKIVLDAEFLSRFVEVQEQYSGVNIEKLNTVNDLAYVIYTSGTTGNPKGVMIGHKSLYNYLKWCSGFYFEKEEEGNFGLFSSLSFDLTVTSIFLPLIRGNKIKVYNNNLNAYEVLQDYILDSTLDIIKLTPSHLELLNGLDLEEILLKKIIVGGESLLSRQVDEILKQNNGLRIYNEYGPTESTVGCLVKIISKDSEITIGKPISNTHIYILDEYLGALSIGVTGKIYISGAGLARGYLNKAELTSEKFISNPFIEGTLMYDTGDLGRWLPDGDVEFLGRKDHQVKIRGFRIELGEIENAISQYSEALKQVVVEAKAAEKEQVLVAYYTAIESIDKSALRSFLQEKLPDYMVPVFYVELDELPLTPNGKIDRNALPGIDGEDLIRKEYVAPGNEVEEKLATIWQEVLGIEKIGITDNFFELGGNSIKAVRMITKIKLKFDMQFPITLLFRNPNIYLLSGEINSNNNKSANISSSLLVTINESGQKTPIFCTPGSGGECFNYKQLSQALGSDQPFYGLKARGLDAKLSPHKTIEEIASSYIKEIQRIDPRGPYILGGYSFGGKTAFEMALQLEKKGFEVKHLLIFDSFAPDKELIDYSAFHPQTYQEWLVSLAKKASDILLDNDSVELTINELEYLNEEDQLNLFHKKLIDLGGDIAKDNLKGYVNVYIQNSTMSYTPGDMKLICPIILFRSTRERVPLYDSGNTDEMNEDTVAIAEDEDYRWKEFTTNSVTVHKYECTHTEIMSVSHHVEGMAKELTALLN